MTYPTKAEIKGVLNAFAKRKVREGEKVNEQLIKDQVDGVYRLIELSRNKGSTLFYGDTGVGKTIQAIVASAFLAAEGTRRILILAPSTAVLKERWSADMKVFLEVIAEANRPPSPPSWARKLSSVKSVKATLTKLPPTSPSNPEIWLSTTPSLAKVAKGTTRNSLGHRKRWIERLHPCLVVIDEAHMRTGQDTKAREVMESLVIKMPLLSLTATPVSQDAKSLQQIVSLNGDGSWAKPVTAYQEGVHSAVRKWWSSGGNRDSTEKDVGHALKKKAKATAAFRENVVRQEPLASKQEEPMKITIQLDENGDWVKGYGLARILPALLGATEDVQSGDSESGVVPSDAYRRMLLSSPAAFWSSVAAKTLNRRTKREWRTIQEELGALLGAHGAEVLGSEQLKHPKVRWTAEHAVEQAQDRQVLVFVQYLKTIDALVAAINTEAQRRGVRVAVGPARDKTCVAEFRKQSKGGILVASPRDSMGLEFDHDPPGKEQRTRLLICHDLPWSAVMLQQQVGRLRRASNGFPKIEARAPILDIPDDLRVYDTVMGRWHVADIVDLQGGFAGNSDDGGVQGLPGCFPPDFIKRLRL